MNTHASIRMQHTADFGNGDRDRKKGEHEFGIGRKRPGWTVRMYFKAFRAGDRGLEVGGLESCGVERN